MKYLQTSTVRIVEPDPEDVKGFDEFIEKYTKCLAIERAAVENLENTR